MSKLVNHNPWDYLQNYRWKVTYRSRNDNSSYIIKAYPGCTKARNLEHSEKPVESSTDWRVPLPSDSVSLQPPSGSMAGICFFQTVCLVSESSLQLGLLIVTLSSLTSLLLRVNKDSWERLRESVSFRDFLKLFLSYLRMDMGGIQQGLTIWSWLPCNSLCRPGLP